MLNNQNRRRMVSRVVMLAVAVATVAIPWQISAAAHSRTSASHRVRQSAQGGQLKVVQLEVSKDSGSALGVSATVNNNDHPTAIIRLLLYRLGEYGAREANVPEPLQDQQITLGEHAVTGSSVLPSKLQSADYELVCLLDGSIYNGSRRFFHINKNGSLGPKIGGHVPVIDTFSDNDSVPAQPVGPSTIVLSPRMTQHQHMKGQNSNNYVAPALDLSSGTVAQFQVEVWLDCAPDGPSSSLSVTLYNRTGSVGSYKPSTTVAYILGESFDGAVGKSILPSNPTSNDAPYYYPTVDLTSTGTPLYNGSYMIGVVRPGYGDTEVYANFDVVNSPSGNPPSQLRKN